MPRATGSTQNRAARAAIPGMVVAYIIIFLLPIELSFYLGPLFMTPTRVFLMVTAVPLIVILFTREKLMAIDFLLMAYVMWVVLAFLVKRGTGGLEAAGQSFLEATVSYLVARLFFKEAGQVVRYIMVISLTIFVLGLLAIPEAIGHTRYLHDIPKMLTGISYVMQDDLRLGLLRAASTFENPILFGLYCATFLSLVWYSTYGLGIRLALGAGIVMATGLSLSSAPMLLLVLQIVLIAAEHATRRIKRRAFYIVVGVLAAVAFIETFSNSGVAGLIASHLTFNPSTAYYRLLQWRFSIDDVMANPFFGINFENWTRPYWLTDSIDNNWLLLAMRSGLPAVMLLFAGLALLAYRLYRRRKTMRDPVLKSLMLGWIIGMSALFLGAWTVALFGKMTSAMFFLIGLGAALLQMKDSAVADTPVLAQQHQRGASRFTRFAPAQGGDAARAADFAPAVAPAARPRGHSRG